MRKTEGFLSVVDASEYTGLSIEAIRDLMDEGELPFEDFNGTQRIRKTELDNWLDEQASPEQLLSLLGKLKDAPDVEEVAEMLGMEEQEVQEHLEG